MDNCIRCGIENKNDKDLCYCCEFLLYLGLNKISEKDCKDVIKEILKKYPNIKLEDGGRY